ncbi:MAG TPA: ribulose-phosphate 3-epimerase [Candidatus Saccharimonadales bacterium]|nr:ribulose-phosphate 3-epimerase [Candidatus Saccharimonadales bacterium]
MIKCSTSLWSADLTNLAHEMKRVEPYSERFHLDVADGHYVKTMLFFPDLVKALRPHTKLPFEVHLMVTDPMAWIEPFADAGADIIIFCLDSAQNPVETLRAIRKRGKKAGVSLLIKESIDLLEPIWNELDILTLVGTEMGIKGASMDSSVLEKIRLARDIVFQRSLPVELEADGGIRRETAPLLKASGVDYIVPGSLMFKKNPKKMREWLDDL